MKIYDILLKNGTIIDPSNNINSKLDIAISSTKIAKVSKSIDESKSKQTIDAKDLIICPGLIDIHAHSFGYWEAIFPDEMCLPFGTTTMLDAGGPGWKTFDRMKDDVIRKSKTRVFSLLNIVGSGMIMDGEQNVSDMDPEATAAKINERKDMLVGVKVAHFEANSWEAIKRGKKAAEDSGTFIMVDQNPISGRNMEVLLDKYMTSGDILTHVYAWGKPILDNNKKVYKYFFEAREKGILTVGVVTKPFHFEGSQRMKLAEKGIEELQQYVDTLLTIPNQNLFRIANEKTTFSDAFKMADDVLYAGVRGVTDLMVQPGMINLDFSDIKTVMSEMGKAMMGTGEAQGEGRAIAAAEAAIANPLIDDVSLKVQKV